MEALNANPKAKFLVHTPFGKDAVHLCKLLAGAGFTCVTCPTLADVADAITDDVSAVLTTEEALAAKTLPLLIASLRAQPKWSAIPVLVFYTPFDEHDTFHKKLVAPITELSDTTFIQRPVSSSTLLSAVKAAVRDRNRQYETRHLLERLQEDLEEKEAKQLELNEAREKSEAAKLVAELANQTKSQFLANMSHEIRTPLGAIMGFADLLEQPDLAREDLKRFLSVIRRNSNQLLSIINDILDLSKVEAGKMMIENVNFSLPELMSDLTSLLGLKAREGGVNFTVDARVDLPRIIKSDPTRLRQILLNIVGNAIKFSPGGDVVLSLDRQDDLLVFEVRDTGRGISDEQRETLFQPFSQADASITRKFGGTGLGLVLTKRLCEMMGGTLTLKASQLGHGSTFVANVRIETVVNETHDETVTPGVASRNGDTSARLAKMQILVVEDSPDNQDLIRIILTKAGIKVDIASDGLEGVTMSKGRNYDVILMDVQMPRMDGIQAVKILRERGTKIPIVALTAHAMKEERARCLNAGFSSFLTKPLQIGALMQLLENL